jgi:translation initiation factor IF-2
LFVVGANWGKVRTLTDDKGNDVESVGPSSPVEITGLKMKASPFSGDKFEVVTTEKEARQLAEERAASEEYRQRTMSLASASNLIKNRSALPIKTLSFIVKTAVQGSAEALQNAVEQVFDEDDRVRVEARVIRAASGSVRSEDIILATVSKATVFAFDTEVPRDVLREARTVGIEVKEHNVVYSLLDDVRAEMASYLRPPPSKALGTLIGELTVKQMFSVGKVQSIDGNKVAGCGVDRGLVKVGSRIRVVRDIDIVYEGTLNTLRSFRDLVDVVEAPNDCGLSLEAFSDVKEGDKVEVYSTDADAVAL